MALKPIYKVEYFSWPFLLHVDLFPQFFSECRVYIRRLKPWVLAIYFILPFPSILRFLNPAIQQQSRRYEGAVGAFAPTLFGKIHKICTHLSIEVKTNFKFLKICNHGFKFLKTPMSHKCNV